MENLKKNILKQTIYISALILIVFLIIYIYKGNEVDKIKDNAISLAVKSFALISSSLVLAVVIALEKNEKYKELMEYGPYLALACFIAIIYSAYDVFIMFYNLF